MAHTITADGLVPLPEEIRDRLGVKPGEDVEFRTNEKGEVVVEAAAEARPKKSVADLVGLFGPGMSTDEVMRLTRGDDWPSSTPTSSSTS